MSNDDLSAEAFRGRRLMLLRAFLTFNIVLGSAFGGFGVSVLALRDRFHTGLGLATLGLSLVVLTIGLVMPITAMIIARFGLRTTMMIGVAFGAAGYIVLALAQNMIVVLLGYALLIGVAGAMAGSLPSSLLAGGWYPNARGRAVGITMMPVVLGLAPLVGYFVIEKLGLSAFYLLLAGLHLALLPVLLGVREPPVVKAVGPITHQSGGIPAGQLLLRPMFWILVLGSGVLYSIGITDATHMVAVLVERSISRGEAALLVSIMGGAAVFGSLGIGYLADRLGGAGALAIIGAGFAGAWAVIGLTTWLPVLIPAMIVAGSCSAGVFAALNVAAAHFFGPATLGRAVGFLGACMLPLTFLLPPGAGLLREITGAYGAVIVVIVAITALVSLMFIALVRKERRALAAPSHP